MATPSSVTTTDAAAATTTITATTPSVLRNLRNKKHVNSIKKVFDGLRRDDEFRGRGISTFIIKAKPSRDNINFITPPVTPHVYPVSPRDIFDSIITFEKFSERFCSKFYIPDDVSMCISLFFNREWRRENSYNSIHELVSKIVNHHSLYVSKDNDSNIPPSFYFLHVLNAINSADWANMEIGLETLKGTFKEVGVRVSASVLRYSLFELNDVYLRILIESLNNEGAPPSLLLDAHPDLAPLTGCHARVLAARIKRMGILPKDGTMSTAIYRLYFDTIERCSDDLCPIPFDSDMVYSDCVFELKHLVRQGKITMKTEKKRLLVVEKEGDAPASKRRCVVSSEGGRVTIVKKDLSSSLLPLESESDDDGEELVAFLSENETALARLLKRLETSSYCSYIDMEDAPGACGGNNGDGGGAKEMLVRFFESVLSDWPLLFVFGKYMSIDGFNTAVRILERNKGGAVEEEKLLSDIRKHRNAIEPLHKCGQIHTKSTLRPAIELSLGKDFPFEATVLSIFNRLSAFANDCRKGRPADDDVLNEFSPAGYTSLAETFIAMSIRKKTVSIRNGEERELKVLKDLVDMVEVLSRNNSDNNRFHFYGLVSWLLDPGEGYKYQYPEANRDAFFSYVLDKLCNYFTEKGGRTRSFYEKNLFDKVKPDVYSSCIKRYLEKRAFAADVINAAIDAMCYVESGHCALVWIIRNAFPDNEDGKKTAFMRMIRNTVAQMAPPSSPTTDKERPPLPSTSLEELVETFPDMCYIADKDFGVLRECIERESLAFHEILALPNVRATINCRYRYYGNAPAICLGHLMVDMVQPDNYVCAFLENGANPLVTTDGGENIMHFMARVPHQRTIENRPLDSSVTSVVNSFWTKNGLAEDSETTKRLFAARRHFDGATPTMVAVAHRNWFALEYFKTHFYVDAFRTAFGRSDCLRTIDVIVLSGMLFPNLEDVTTARPSVRLLAKAALEGKLYYNGGSSAPLNMVGLTMDEYAYRGARNIRLAICHNECLCKIASDVVQTCNKLNKKVPSFEHKDDIWCALNCASKAIVEEIYYSKGWITYCKSFKKEYVQLCTAIADNNREILEKMARIGEKRKLGGNLTYNDGKCSICYEELDETVDELNYIKECDHVYHKLCITKWEKNRRKRPGKCPTCNTVCEDSTPRRDEDVIVAQG